VGKGPVAPKTGSGLIERRVVVAAQDAIAVKALIEAHEGVACVFAERGGDLTLAAPEDRRADLDALVAAIDELLRELHARRT
jgi:hypothetical protein